MLAIPAEQQLELRRSMEAEAPSSKREPSVPKLPGLDAALVTRLVSIARPPRPARASSPPRLHNAYCSSVHKQAAGVDLAELELQLASLAAECGAVRSGEPGTALALVPPPQGNAEQSGAEEAQRSDAAAAARASALSLLALRLSSGADAEEAREDEEQAASKDSVARLAVVKERLERRRAQQMVEQSLASLGLGEADG